MTLPPEIPETRDQLAHVLDRLGVRPGTYDLHGVHVPDAMVLDSRPDGWAVFYSERGREVSSKTHESEAAACRDLFERVTKDRHSFFQLVAGPLPAAEADLVFDAWLAERGTTRGRLERREWKYDDIPWTIGDSYRRYFVRVLAIRRLEADD